MSKVRRTSSRRRKRVKPDAKAGKPRTPEVPLTDLLLSKREKLDAKAADPERAFRKPSSPYLRGSLTRGCNSGVRGDAVGDLR